MTAGIETHETGFESLRVPIDCEVELKFEPLRVPQRMLAANISMKGMFIRGTEVYAPGTECSVRFALQEGEPPIRGKAEVLWCRKRHKGPNKPQGIGIRFLDLDLESKYAISRLVDQYLSLGGVPLQLGPSDLAAETRRARSAGRRFAMFLPLAFLAGIAAGSLATLWLVQGPEERLSEAGFTADNPRAFGSQERSRAAERDRATQSIGVGDATPAAMQTTLESWARAWSEKDVERYLSFYAEDFRPHGQSREAWEAQRRDRLARPGAIDVEISAVEIEDIAEGRGAIRFDQAFSSPGYQDRVKKRLDLVRKSSGWKIVREETE